MDEKRTIIKVAEGNFPFHFFIQKAIPSMEAGQMIVEGVASTPNVDHDKERMSVEALKSMASIINKQGVPLRVEHSQADNAIIGNVNKAWIDDRNNLWIKAVLDEKHPAAGILYKGLKEGVKMGLSVGGYVRRAVQEMVEGLGKSVNTFYDVLLDEVSVTQKPSNYDARLMAKSFAKSEGEVDALAGLFESNEFLFHSAMGESNYLTAFSKSIPESEWKDVDENYKLDINKSMDTEKEKTTKAEEAEEKTTKAAEETGEEKTTKASEKEEEKTEKAVSRSEFNDLVKMVSQGFNGLTGALTKMAKAMETDAKVQANPGKDMEDINNEGKTAKASGGDAVDQEQPKKDKIDPEEGKGMGKSAEDEEKTTKANDDTYDLETVERAIKTISDFNKGGDDTEKTTKASEDSEKVTKSRAEVSNIDKFVIEVATAIERMEKSMKEGGFQTEHIAKSVINEIRSNPEYQKDITAFMKEAGPKRSVINGTPFVKTKDGRMFKLTLDNAGGERTEKAQKDAVPAAGSFKTMWGNNFSSQKASE